MKRIASLVISISWLALAGCASMSIDKNSLQEKGILVGRVNFPYSTLHFEPGGDFRADPDGYFGLALKPGIYTLKTDQMTKDVTSGGYNLTIFHYNIFALNIKFEIKPGAVTDLGLIHILTEQQSLKYWAYTFDIHEELSDYLHSKYPETFSEVSNPPVLHFGKFVAPDKFKDVRAFAFGKELQNTLKNPIISRTSLYAGPLGTIASYDIVNHKISNLNFMDNSFFEIPSCIVTTPRSGYCLIHRPFKSSLFATVAQQRISTKELPFDADKKTVVGVTQTGQVVLVDRRMRVYLSPDAGQSWKSTLTADTPELPKDEQRPVDQIKIYEGKKGTYVFGAAQANYFLFKPKDSLDFKKINAPSDHITHLLETQAGIFLKKTGGLFSSDTLYFSSDSGTTYKELEAPSSFCAPEVLDYSKSTMRLECSYTTAKKKYVGSALDGKWTETK